MNADGLATPRMHGRYARSTIARLGLVLGLLAGGVGVVASGVLTQASVAPGSVTEIQVTGRFGIPNNAEAVAINLAAVNPSGNGFLAAYPCGTQRSTNASTVNHDTSAATSNAAIVKIGTGGKICVYSFAATDIIADVTGWYPANADYNAITPDRLLDTRPNNRATNSSVTEIQVTGRFGIPNNAEAVAINLAAVNPSGNGFLAAYPCGTQRSTNASTVNHDTSAATSNAAIVKIGTGGKICVYSFAATDIIADVTGWYPANADYNAITPDRLLDTRSTPGSGPSPTPPVTVVPPQLPPSAFYEAFTGNTGLDRFTTGVYHRDDVMVTTNQWSADHDENCGDPSTQRTVQRNAPAQSFYLCRDHLMTSVGDTSGYSIAWFSPNQTFQGGVHTKVSFDVNVTDLLARQWWEVSISPVGSPFLATVDWIADVAEIETYDSETIVVGKGPFGDDGSIITRGVSHDPLGWGHVCDVDREGCGSKAIRRTFTVTDNRNGTVTFDFLGQRYTYQGEFPNQFKVYFKDHNYTPDKDGNPAGYTWHWDNILVT